MQDARRGLTWMLLAFGAAAGLLLVEVPDTESPSARAIGVVLAAGLLAFLILGARREFLVFAVAKGFLRLAREDWPAFERAMAELEAARIQSIYDED